MADRVLEFSMHHPMWSLRHCHEEDIWLHFNRWENWGPQRWRDFPRVEDPNSSPWFCSASLPLPGWIRALWKLWPQVCLLVSLNLGHCSSVQDPPGALFWRSMAKGPVKSWPRLPSLALLTQSLPLSFYWLTKTTLFNHRILLFPQLLIWNTETRLLSYLDQACFVPDHPIGGGQGIYFSFPCLQIGGGWSTWM